MLLQFQTKEWSLASSAPLTEFLKFYKNHFLYFYNVQVLKRLNIPTFGKCEHTKCVKTKLHTLHQTECTLSIFNGPCVNWASYIQYIYSKPNIFLYFSVLSILTMFELISEIFYQLVSVLNKQYFPFYFFCCYINSTECLKYCCYRKTFI